MWGLIELGLKYLKNHKRLTPALLFSILAAYFSLLILTGGSTS